ncbi:MAG: ferritin family protein [Candidatus Lernaella stagnicola]|nr:ferritin family protein [Candidatus Lernaella stagnicola]
MITLDDFSLADAIDLAMQAEADAAAFYAAAAESSTDPRGQDMFGQLARFERAHFESLKRLRESLLSGDWPGYTGTEFLPERPGGNAGTLDDVEKAAAVDVINIALEAEQKAEQAYLDLAERAQAPEIVEMFRKLASEESLHHKVLEDQFYALTNEGHWKWGE